MEFFFEIGKEQYVAFLSFECASGLCNSGEWQDYEAALEASSTPATFKKIMSIISHLPLTDQKKIDRALDAIQNVSAGATTIWVSRNSFESLVQKPGQPFRQFLSEVIERAHKCQFGDGYCAVDKQTAVDDQILNKIVFGINNQMARQKLFEEKHLTLEWARTICENTECVQDT